MVFVEKPDMEAEVKDTKGTHVPAIKHKSRMVICGNRQPWEADERTSTNNLDASLLRWMLSTWAHRDTTWTTVDISTAFLTVKMPAEQLVLLKPPAVLVRLGLLKENDIWIATRAVYGLRSVLNITLNALPYSFISPVVKHV
eukprot:2052206-Amphidinium_carterae.1